MLATIVTMIVGYVVISMLLIAVIVWPVFGIGVLKLHLGLIRAYLYMIIMAPCHLPKFASSHLTNTWWKLYDESPESMIERETEE